MAKIIYTRTDEAPLMATYSLKPIVEAFASTSGVEVETRDISLAARILAAFNDLLPEEQRVNDALAELGELTGSPTRTSSSCRTSPPPSRSSRPPSPSCAPPGTPCRSTRTSRRRTRSATPARGTTR